MILVNDDEMPCQDQDAENFQGFNECMEDAISGHLGCDLPWTNSSNGKKKYWACISWQCQNAM